MGSVFVFWRGFCQNVLMISREKPWHNAPLDTLVIRQFNPNLNCLLYASVSSVLSFVVLSFFLSFHVLVC